MISSDVWKPPQLDFSHSDVEHLCASQHYKASIYCSSTAYTGELGEMQGTGLNANKFNVGKVDAFVQH